MRSTEDLLRNAVLTSGLSVNALAKQAGIPQPVLSRLLNGERTITLMTADKLLRYFGLEIVPKRPT
jgi:plasmid maintenance system antidote protein VapI